MKKSIKFFFVLLPVLLIISFVLTGTSVASAFTVDAGAIPISGATQWPSVNTATFTSGVQFQVVRSIRTSSHNLKLLYLNSTADPITFQASVRKGFNGTPEMVTFNGATTMTMPAYSATTSDQLSFSANAGEYIYDRTFFPNPNQSFSSQVIPGTANPEGVTIPGSLSGLNLTAGQVDTTVSRLMETGTTFEHDFTFGQLFANGFVFGAYAVLGIPNDSTVRLTTFVGDSKMADLSVDHPGSTSGKGLPALSMGLGVGLPYQNLSINGDVLANLVASPSTYDPLRRSVLSAFPTDVINHYGTNSVGNAAVPATAATNELNYISQLKSLLHANSRLYQITLDPVATKTSTSSWATITPADQIPGGDGLNGIATTLYLNTLLRNNTYPYIDGVIDLATITTDSNSYWLPNMTTDGIHQSSAANIAQAAALDTVWPYSYDNTPPTITNVTSNKANGSYGAGEVIDIDLTFSEPVTSTGSITVTLETGTVDRACAFSITSSTTGTCNYTVQPGDTSSDLTVSSVAGTIGDEVDNVMVDFTPATNLADNKALVIDTTAPNISSVSVTTGTTTASITWTTDESASSIVDYGLSASYSSSTVETDTSPRVSSHSVSISGLSACTSYHYSIRSKDAALNTGSSTNNIFVTTNCPPTIVTSPATLVYRVSVNLSGNITSNNDSVSTERGFVYGLTTSYGATSTESGVFGIGEYTTQIIGFTCGKTYHYRAFATNLGGTNYGADTVFNTMNCVSGSRVLTPVVEVPVSNLSTPLTGTATSTLATTPISFENSAGNLASTSASNSFSTSTPVYIFTKDLKFGFVGQDVKQLQAFLNTHGFPVTKTGVGSSGKESTYFGPATKTALIKFQKAYSIVPAVGYFGPITREIVNKINY